MKRKSIVLCAALAAVPLSAGPAPAADFGLGAAYLDGLTVLLPIRTERLLIEPEVSLSNQSSAASGGSSLKSTELGSGVYLRTGLGPSFEGYGGGRLAYHQLKQSSGTGDSKSTGFSLGPTVGAQYFLEKQVSLGLDASLEYTHSKLEQTGQPSATLHGWGTLTRVVLRGFF